MKIKTTAFTLAALLMTSSASFAAEPHTVQSGESLFSIAQKNNTTVHALESLNTLDSSCLYPGQTVFVPSFPKQYKVKQGDRLFEISLKTGVSYAILKAANPQITNENVIFPGQLVDVPSSAKKAQPSPDKAPAPAKQPAPQTAPPSSDSISAKAKEVAALVNKERQNAGLPALALNEELSSVALVKAKDMIQQNYFSHTSPVYGSPFDMMKRFGVPYTAAGENIAKGQPSAAEVMKDWMNSQGHRENILSSSYDSIGVGYYQGAWVQLFKK
ncbi:LysM peptidoglycan-binding domain-containing protein [Fictibacillus iocasae]|uniref:LysM peptidoglycan-binding domain-containing protein n=1 Tax=Fictibacillus iocasae TaxID=2715437 RepID=A0ABW2NN54_9BACL